MDTSPRVNPRIVDWSKTGRESFFAAVARHRRAAWRVTLAAAIADALFAFVVAILMSPLFYALIALVLDLINLVHPAPNLVKIIAATLDPVFNPGKAGIRVRDCVHLAVLAALPGILWMGWVLLMLRPVLMLSGTFSENHLSTRAMEKPVFVELRFPNVVWKLRLRAGLPVPKIRIYEDAKAGAVAFSENDLSTRALDTRVLAEQRFANVVGRCRSLREWCCRTYASSRMPKRMLWRSVWMRIM